MVAQTDAFIFPNWDAPKRVNAVVTTRKAGFSHGPYAGLNVGTHVGDELEVVRRNRTWLQQQLNLKQPPCWLEQIHGTSIIDLDDYHLGIQADGSFTRKSSQVCAIMTADCLPVFLCDTQGRQVMALHAGWRSLLAGIIERGCQQFPADANIIAWLGPAICQKHFEVGSEVRAQFVAVHEQSAEAFIAGECADKWYCDLSDLAKLRLEMSGVRTVYDSKHCTYNDSEKFYSFRRSKQTGRMVSLIWLED